MYPWYQGYTVGSELPNDDRNAIQELYGAKVKGWATYNPPPRPTTTTTTTTTTTPRTYYPIRNNPHYNPNPYPYPPQRPTVDSRHYYYNNHDNNNNNNHNNNNNKRHNYPTHHNPRYDQTPRTYYPDYRTPPTTRRSYITPTTTATTTTTTTTRRPRIHPTQRYNPPQRTPTKTHRTSKPRKPKPDSCLTHYDAISMIRGELFIFRGQVSFAKLFNLHIKCVKYDQKDAHGMTNKGVEIK